MNGFFTMVKMNLKLLLRNKGYLSFLVILPIISIIMLNIDNINSSDNKDNTYVIHEIRNENDLISSMVNNKLNVKVYDCSKSKLSDYILKELAKTGSYRVFRYQSGAMDINTVREKALDSANYNMLGAIIYFPDTFEEKILSGGESNMVVFAATKDSRIELMENSLEAYLSSVCRFAEMSGYNKKSLESLLDDSVKNEMNKEKINIEVGDTLNLTAKQLSNKSSISYSLAFLTVGFLFSGVFIAATVIEERQNRAYNRFLLSNASLGSYGLVKLLLVFITVLIQTGILAVGIKLFVKTDFGIPFASYLFFVFCLGLIFNLLSVVTGILTNNVLTSNYIVFLVWCMSDLLAGLYFPLDGASKLYSQLSMLMPQRWVVKASEMLMAGKSGVYSMFILVMLSYLMIITCAGLIGIKLQRKE